MSAAEEYNGWSNFETWAAALHQDNDEGTYTQAREWAAEARAKQDAYEAIEGVGVRYLAERIQLMFEDEREMVLFPQPGEPGSEWGRMMLADVGSLWRVDWHEIAAATLAE